MSCSSCLGVNVFGYECGWCNSTTVCSVTEECSNGFTISTASCPRPVIDGVEPSTGPMEGGTRVTITGSNLGAVFSDIVQVRLISADESVNVSCSLTGLEDSYVIGEQVVCETEAVPSTEQYSLVVQIRRDSGDVFAEVDFSVVQPEVSEVDPEFGPESGGIEVVISGSSLNIGNTEDTRVTLNDINCEVTG